MQISTAERESKLEISIGILPSEIQEPVEDGEEISLESEGTPGDPGSLIN